MQLLLERKKFFSDKHFMLFIISSLSPYGYEVFLESGADNPFSKRVISFFKVGIENSWFNPISNAS